VIKLLNKNKLRGAIVAAGMTQNEVAARIGISRNTFSAKVNGKTCFDSDQIEKICQIVGIIDPAEKANIFLSESSRK